jgi:hypothetical protein
MQAPFARLDAVGRGVRDYQQRIVEATRPW